MDITAQHCAKVSCQHWYKISFALNQHCRHAIGCSSWTEIHNVAKHTPGESRSLKPLIPRLLPRLTSPRSWTVCPWPWRRWCTSAMCWRRRTWRRCRWTSPSRRTWRGASFASSAWRSSSASSGSGPWSASSAREMSARNACPRWVELLTLNSNYLTDSMSIVYWLIIVMLVVLISTSLYFILFLENGIIFQNQVHCFYK